MNKHTPGPWVRKNISDIFTNLGAVNADGVEAPANDGWMIADCDVGGLSLGEVSENSRLMAAAPELLEALEAARELIKGDLTGPDWRRACNDFLRAADAAIAKATGEPA